MIANTEKFHAIVIRKDQNKTSEQEFDIQGTEGKSEESVKLLGIHLVHKSNFDPHISELCRKTAGRRKKETDKRSQS